MRKKETLRTALVVVVVVVVGGGGHTKLNMLYNSPSPLITKSPDPASHRVNPPIYSTKGDEKQQEDGTCRQDFPDSCRQNKHAKEPGKDRN